MGPPAQRAAPQRCSRWPSCRCRSCSISGGCRLASAIRSIFLEAEQKGWLHTSTFFPQVWLDYFGLLLQSWGTTTPATDPALGWGGGQRLYLYQDLGFSLLFAALAAWAAWRRSLRPSELAWLALGVIFPLSLGTTIGVARYMLPLWPAFLLLARGLAPRPVLERGWLLASAGLLAATTYFWASGHWMDRAQGAPRSAAARPRGANGRWPASCSAWPSRSSSVPRS